MTKKKKRDGFFKDLFEEIAGTVIVEVLIFIPRIIIRAISKIWWGIFVDKEKGGELKFSALF